LIVLSFAIIGGLIFERSVVQESVEERRIWGNGERRIRMMERESF